MLVKNSLKTKELGEQESPVNPEPKSGTSDKQTGASGYPEVGKWESGINRGPANQIGVTKWSDVVGANLKRSKANQLKEQDDWWNKSSYDKGIWDKSSKYGENFSKNWDDWGQWGLTIGSIAAAFFIPGAQGLAISAILDLIVAADMYFRQKDSVGAGVATTLAFVPIFGDVLRIGKMSNKSIANLIKKFGPLKTEEQVLNAIKSLPPRSVERYTIEQIIKMGPKDISKLINTMVKNGIKSKSDANNVVNYINRLYKEGKLTKEGVKNLYNKLGLRRFLFDIVVSGGIIYKGMKIKQEKNEKEILNIIQRDKSERPARPEDFN